MSAATDLEVTLDAAGAICFDNEAVVAILTTRTSKGPALMHLLHDLLLSTACWGSTFNTAHVPGVENKIADAISRFCWQEFRQLAPDAHSSPCSIPQLLLVLGVVGVGGSISPLLAGSSLFKHQGDSIWVGAAHRVAMDTSYSCKSSYLAPPTL
ncbi:unnamed protein product [Porites evermanni]|uniref:RNase H type-1 domain-containing protein n=1 Tax=Porites evermanni TaxID=104178 RepID=A0ABN8MQG9_9CNID|nr:unnamed protein product [Porites evermanni]